jgi:AcrR family transcriptional regulator
MARPHLVSDEQLRNVAHQVFLEKGPNTSVAAVAKRLGISAPALFQRVGSKERLLIMALLPEPPAEYALLKNGFHAGVNPEAQLIKILTGLSRYLFAAVPAAFMLRAVGVTINAKILKGEPQPILLRRLLARWLVQAYKPAMKPNRAKLLANLFLSALEALNLQHYLERETYSPTKAHAFVRSLVKGLLP